VRAQAQACCAGGFAQPRAGGRNRAVREATFTTRPRARRARARRTAGLTAGRGRASLTSPCAGLSRPPARHAASPPRFPRGRYEPTGAKIVKGRWAEYVRHFSGGLELDELLACVAFEPHALAAEAPVAAPTEGGAVRPAPRFSHWTRPLRLPARPPGDGVVGVELRGPPVGLEATELAAVELAAAPNTSVVASWHGTLEGEVAGWSGLWALQRFTPVLSHYVGGMDKVAAMLALGWWRWETELVVAAMPRAPGALGAAARPLGAVTAPMQRHFARGALPRVLALAGAGASGWHADYAVAARAQAARRLWLSVVASALGRVAAEPVADCTQPWLVRVNNSAFGNHRRFQRWPRQGIFQEVDELSRVGATLGDCRAGFSPPLPHAQGLCCFPLFDVRSKVEARLGVRGLPGAHHRLVDAALAQPGARRVDVDWDALGVALGGGGGGEGGWVNASELVARIVGRPAEGAADAAVLVLHVPAGFAFPQLRALDREARESLCADLAERCLAIAPPAADALPVWPEVLVRALRDKGPGELNAKSSVGQWVRDHPGSG
jgi:hypothetical protein